MTTVDTAVRPQTNLSGSAGQGALRQALTDTAAAFGIRLNPSQIDALVQSLSPLDRLLATPSPLARFQADPAAGAQPATVTVRGGDTLSGIASRSGVSLDAMIAANPQLRDPNLIRPGERLIVPAGGTGESYTVRAGDTLSGIGERLGLNWRDIAAANGLRNPDQLQIGQTLRLPGVGQTQPAAGADRPTAPRTETPRAEAPRTEAPTTGPRGGVNASGVSPAGMDALFNREAQAGVSNRLHMPGGASGVTLGPGYDLKGRSREEVISTLTGIGVDRTSAARVAEGVGLTGQAARNFASANRDAVNLTPTQERALLDRVVQPYAADVQRLVRVPLSQNQYDSLVSFAYNIGTGRDGFPDSTVLRRLNAGDYRGAADAMAMWNKSDGAVNQGLVNRRAGEIEQFNRPSGPAAAPGAAPTRETAPTAPAGTAPSRTPEGYAAYIRENGDVQARADLDAGRRVVLALRTTTDVRANGGRGVYDDTIAIVQKGADGRIRVQEFRANTEPSGQYRYDGPKADRGSSVDMNRDGRNDSGRLLAGSYRYTQESGNFLGDRYYRATRTTPVERDTNQDGRFTSADTNRIDRSGAGTSMLIHRGGDNNTWSAGCQTIPNSQYADFKAALGGQTQFSYVLVNAN